MKLILKGYDTTKKTKQQLEKLYAEHIKATYETNEIRKVSMGNETTRKQA